MSTTWKKLWQHNATVVILTGLSVVFAFPKWNFVVTALAFSFLAQEGVRRAQTLRQAFFFGYWVSFVVSLGGFYWVTYVIKVFGYMPWSLAFLVFLGFCTFAALNFPAFTASLWYLNHKFQIAERSPAQQAAWAVLGIPALYVAAEYLIPKLFPWYLGHSLHVTPLLIQISDITGSIALSFLLVSLGSAFALVCRKKRPRESVRWAMVSFSALTFVVLYGFWRFASDAKTPKEPIQVALVQANIGSLEKAAARKGVPNSVRHVVDTYKRLTTTALQSKPRPDLVLWPETAMPVPLDNLDGRYSKEIREAVLGWNTALVTGGYARSVLDVNRDHNTAFLFESIGNGKLHEDLYHKNILLAFGEYLPLGDTWPILYRYAPQVSNFKRGESQNAFTIGPKGLRFGVTICYEAIVPSFYRKVIANKVNAVINLTNDSWFGPTAEPYLHGALTVFRAVENRVPLMRVTNTGSSFVVDTLGQRSRLTPVYEEDVLLTRVDVPKEIPLTVYQLLGDWFILLCASVVAGFAVLFLKHAPLPH